jgi:hypothetical protein
MGSGGVGSGCADASLSSEKMAGHGKGPATFYLQPPPFSGDRKWPETESGQIKEAARERKGLEKRQLNGLSRETYWKERGYLGFQGAETDS